VKTLTLIVTLLLCFGASWTPQKDHKPYDITLRDDREPINASFQSASNDFSVTSCDEYGFGAAGKAKIEMTGCVTQISFDFTWRGGDFSYRPRKRPDVTVTIKAGDQLHGEFTVDTCGKHATGLIRNDSQNIILSELSDTDTTDSEGYCGGPPHHR